MLQNFEWILCVVNNLHGNWQTKKMTSSFTRPLPALSVPRAREKKEATDSSLDSVQRLHFTSSAQGQSVAARTAGFKRLSAPQQKQLVFPNNQGLVGVLQRYRDRGTRWNCILFSSERPPTPVSSSWPSKRKPSIVTSRKFSVTITDKK